NSQSRSVYHTTCSPDGAQRHPGTIPDFSAAQKQPPGDGPSAALLRTSLYVIISASHREPFLRMPLRSLAVASIVAVTLSTAPACAQVQWKIASAYPSGNFHTENLNAFAQEGRTRPAASF